MQPGRKHGRAHACVCIDKLVSMCGMLSVLQGAMHCCSKRPTACMCVGLMSTQSGSIGRLFGNFSITVFGNWSDNTIMLGNEIYLALTVFVSLTALLFIACYSLMQKLN